MKGSLAAFAALAIAGPAYSQANFDHDLCGSRKPDRALSACTRVIQDRHEAPEMRVLALRNRGFIYQDRGDLERAIADYDAAIKLATLTPPRQRSEEAGLLAKTYVNRGVAHAARGEAEQALSDYDAALDLVPDLASALQNREALFFKAR